MLPTHKDAEQRYDTLRQMALDAAQNELREDPAYQNISLKMLDGEALRVTTQWAQVAQRRVHWDWLDGYNAFRFRHPKRFELAIWHKNDLISLTLGRPTYNGTALRLDFIEAGPPKPKEIKVFEITVFAMMAYAELLGAQEIRVMNPINEAVKQYYANFGLQYVAKGDYLTMRI